MHETETQQCPHCAAVSTRGTEFCPACGRRLTSAKPPSRFSWLLGVLRFLRPSDALGENPAGVGEAYKHGPMNHWDH